MHISIRHTNQDTFHFQKHNACVINIMHIILITVLLYNIGPVYYTHTLVGEITKQITAKIGFRKHLPLDT